MKKEKKTYSGKTREQIIKAYEKIKSKEKRKNGVIC